MVTGESEGLKFGIAVEVRYKSKGRLRGTVSRVCFIYYQKVKIRNCDDFGQ